MANQSHENLTSFRDVSQSSNRKFGITVGLILSFVAAWPAIRHHQPPRFGLLTAGLALSGIGLVAPDLLGQLNKLWFKLGLALARITNPIVMGVMFFVAIVPFGWWLRWRGHDLLRLKRDAKASSYWIERDLSAPSSLSKQF